MPSKNNFKEVKVTRETKHLEVQTYSTEDLEGQTYSTRSPESQMERHDC